MRRAKVYLNADGLSVTKLNDGVFYETWTDYFYSLLLHNFFFPATSYELIAFSLQGNQLRAAVKQHFIRSTASTEIDKVKELMASNGFANNRNNDYINIDCFSSIPCFPLPNLLQMIWHVRIDISCRIIYPTPVISNMSNQYWSRKFGKKYRACPPSRKPED